MARYYTLERDIERALCQMVEELGGRCLKWVCPGNAGVPDRIAILPGGLVYFIELKRPNGGRLSALQDVWCDRLHKLGATALIVRSHQDVDDLRVLLEEAVRRRGHGV